MYKLHAIATHFPIALIVVGCIFNFVYIISKKDKWKDLAYWIVIMGSIATIIAFISGGMEEDSLKLTHEQHELVEEHEELGFLAAIFFGVIYLWSVIRKNKFANVEYWIYSLVLLAGTALILITAHHGGQLVYAHQIGTGG